MSSYTPITYEIAIKIAADLIGERENFTLNNEYTRGICETLGDMWGKPGVELSERKEEVLNDMIAYYFNRNRDKHGTIHPDWNGSDENRFKIWVRGHEPDEEAGWRYKLEVVDNKYQDSDGFPISSIAGGDSWTEAFQTAQHFVETALQSDTCIF
jgi:hypothetical protein